MVVKRQPPPPPPPPASATPKYLINLPLNIAFSNLGISFKPASFHGGDGNNGIGAQIHCIHRNQYTAGWRKRNGMREGDVLYKIDGKLIKAMDHHDVMKLLAGLSGNVLIFEKNLGMKDANKHKASHQDENEKMEQEESEPMPLLVPVPVPIPMQQNMNFPIHKPIDTQNNTEASPTTTSACSSPLLHRKQQEELPPPGLTVESNMLSSMFSPINDKNDSMLSKMERCPDLVAIPEGSTSRAEDSNHFGFSSDSSFNSYRNKSGKEVKLGGETDYGEGDCDELQMDTVSVPQQNLNESCHAEFQLASPTFSYSVTTANTETPFTSPIGTEIPSTLSLVQGNDRDEKNISTGSGSVLSARQQYHDSQVSKLKEKYAPIFSPASRSNFSSANSRSGKKWNGKRRHARVGNKKNRSVASQSTIVFNDDFPCKTVDRAPSIESCSVSTLFMSPTQQVVRAPASSSLIPVHSNMNTPDTSMTMRTTPSQPIAYNNIPVTMLDYRYVRECDSVETMGKIVLALKATSPPEFPSLLRLAEKRLIELEGNGKGGQGKTVQNANVNNEKDLNENDKRGNMDGIPSHIDVQIQTDIHSELHVDDYFQDRAPYEAGHKDTKVTNGSMEEDMNDIVLAHAELKVQMEKLLLERDAMQGNLTSQVKSLEQLLEEIQSEMRKQSIETTEEIESLKKAKAEAEDEMYTLRESFLRSSTGAKKISARLKSKEEEIGHLAAQLYKEQEAKRAVMARAESVQDKLQKQVEILTSRLKEQETKTANIKTVIELEVRSEYNGQLQNNRSQIEELEQQLKAATEDMYTLYEENQFIAHEFAKAGMRFESPQQFRNLVTEFAASEACANALAKALTESESELFAILEENQYCKQKISKLQSENSRLEGENEKLTAKINMVGAELRKNNELIDNLHVELEKHKSRQKDYDKLIRKCKTASDLYRSKVERLRAQLVVDANTVSVEAYKKAVDTSESLSRCLKEKEKEVEDLVKRVRNLEASSSKKKDEFIENNQLDVKDQKSDWAVGVQCKVPLSIESNMTTGQNMPHINEGRAAMLEKMKKSRRYQSMKKSVSLFKRPALGAHNSNVTLQSSSAFVDFSGKENM